MIKGILKRAARPLGMAAAAAVLTLAAGGAQAQAKEQFVPVNLYWVGPYAPGGSGVAAGWIDYMALINERDGGINGVKLTWEKCETVVLGFALLPGELDAVDAAVAFVDERHVVYPPGCNTGAARRIRSDPVQVDRHELLLRLRLSPSGRQRQHRSRSRHTQRPRCPFQNSLDHGKYLLK